jgi:hypothetical protein
MNSTQIRKIRDGYYSISCMVGVYNATTKDTRIYMETDRLPEHALLNFFGACGAKTIDYDAFGEEWVSGSMTALSEVRKCGGKDGFTLMETGVSPAAGARLGEGSNGAGEFVFQLSSCDLL